MKLMHVVRVLFTLAFSHGCCLTSMFHTQKKVCVGGGIDDIAQALPNTPTEGVFMFFVLFLGGRAGGVW